MICKKCGEQIPENTKFCPKCGSAALDEELNVSAAGAERAVPRGFAAKKNIIIIIIAAVLLIGGGITAIAVVNSHSASSGVSDDLQLAERYLSEQNYEQAVIEFQKVLEIEPMNVEAYLELSNTYLKLGDYDMALDVLQIGLKNTGDERIRRKIAEFTEPITIRGEELYIISTDRLIVINKELSESTENFNMQTFNERVAEGYRLIFIDSDLTQNEVEELGKLTHLKCLDVEFAGLSDIEPLSALTELTQLDITFNSISDISPLANLRNLTELYLADNLIDDISPLKKLTKLTKLHLSENHISDISPLKRLTNLRELQLSSSISSEDIAQLQKWLPDCIIHQIDYT